MKILIVDDHQAVRTAVRSLLSSHSEWTICGEAVDGLEAVEKARSLRPDLILMDVSMPRMDGVEATRIVRHDVPEADVIIVSQNDPGLVSRQASAVGAQGFVSKSDLGRKLVPMISYLLGEKHDSGAEPASPLKGNVTNHNDDQNAQRFRQALDELPAAIYLTDAEGRLTYYNAAAIQFSGRIPELGTDSWCVTWKLFRPDGTPLAHDQCPMAVALKEGRAVYGEEAIAERPDGTRRWFTPFPRPLRNAEGKIVGGINMLVDITDRKQLHSGSNLLAAIVNSSDDAIVSKNLSGIITSWNKGAERIFGYTSQEVIGRSITLIIPPDHLDEEADILARIRRGERIDHFDTVRRRKDGSLVDVAVTISPVFDAAGRIIGASKVARDVSDRRRAERELRDSKERFRSIVETTPECVKVVAADGTLLQMNAAGLALVGAESPEAVIGENVYNLIAPEDRDRFRSFNERVCAGQKGTLEFDIQGLQGVRRHMETQGAPFRTAAGEVAHLAVTRDITNRKLSERALANAARQQKALFHLADRLHRAPSLGDVYAAATDAICEALQCERASILLCDHAGVMRFVSWRGLSDSYRSAVEGHSPWKIDDPDPRPVCIENVDSAELDEGLRKVVKSEGIVALAFIPLVSENRLIGKFMMYFSHVHDFSADELEVSLTIARQLAFAIERKRADQALRHSEERFRALSETLDAEVRVRTRQLEQRSRELMQHSDQVRDLSRQLLQTQDNERRHFARELHDSAGQTLTVLSMALSQLQQNAAARDPELASQVEASEQLVQQLHREIRTTSYLLHPPLLDESGLASALAWYTQGLAERTPLKINLEVPHDLERIPKHMELGVFRVVQECLTNIHRHSGATDALIHISRSNGTLMLEVADNGKGIPADKLAEIQSKGTGVGIRGMRERVAQFHGEMKIESGPAGTKILLSLPLPASQQRSPAIDASPLAAPAILS